MDNTCEQCGRTFSGKRQRSGHRSHCLNRPPGPIALRGKTPVVEVVDGVECLWVPLTRGLRSLINKADLHLIADRRWCVNSGHYAISWLASGERPAMHRVIMGVERDVQLDHKNGNGLDNRRKNLRICNHSQNQANQRKRSRASSRFKGVHRYRNSKRWSAKIHVNGQRVHLGAFDSERKAALAYDRAATKHFGEFARPNFPLATEE